MNQGWVSDSLLASGSSDPPLGVSEFIQSDVGSYRRATEPLYQDLYLPLWQTVPIAGNQEMINSDGFGYSVSPEVFDTIVDSSDSVLFLPAQTDVPAAPNVVVATPVFEPDTSESSPLTIKGVLIAYLPWKSFFFASLTPPGTPPMTLVIANSCHEPLSFKVEGNAAVFLGEGDHHDDDFDAEEVSFRLNDFEDVIGCETEFIVYPSRQSFGGESARQLPWICASCAAGLFLATATAFYVHHSSFRRRQEELIEATSVSNGLVYSLFPEAVRSRMIDNPNAVISDTKTERIPSKIETRNSKPIADLFPHASVCFMDIAGFTAWSSSREPTQVFTLLESIYSSLDKIARRTKVFKVETVGDSYVATTGLPDKMQDHAGE